MVASVRNARDRPNTPASTPTKNTATLACTSAAPTASSAPRRAVSPLASM
jgi:hypothetical protein